MVAGGFATRSVVVEVFSSTMNWSSRWYSRQHLRLSNVQYYVRGKRFVVPILNAKVLGHCVVSKAPELRLQYVVKRGNKTVACRDRGRWNL